MKLCVFVSFSKVIFLFPGSLRRFRANDIYRGGFCVCASGSLLWLLLSEARDVKLLIEPFSFFFCNDCNGIDDKIVSEFEEFFYVERIFECDFF